MAAFGSLFGSTFDGLEERLKFGCCRDVSRDVRFADVADVAGDHLILDHRGYIGSTDELRSG